MSPLCLSLVLLTGLTLTWAELKSPKVHVYTEKPLEYGKSNVLLCHVSEYHPPRLEMDLFKNGKNITEVKQIDPVFSNDWTYVWTKYAEIIVNEGDEFQCKVAHDLQDPKIFTLNTII